MHTTTFASILSVSVCLIALAHAAPFPAPAWKECSAGQFYTDCQATGWAGCCTVDACSRPWCPDYPQGVLPGGTTVKTPPEKNPGPVDTTGPKPYPFCPRVTGLVQSEYHCYNNGFNGYCSSDPCAISWCPDYEPKTCTPVKNIPKKPACSSKVSELSQGYFVCPGNNFEGYCSSDPCALSWCPDYKHNTCTPVNAAPALPSCGSPGRQYVCASNGFNGLCSVDACNLPWCPDYQHGTYKPLAMNPSTNGSAACS
ncbi:hypothetical protein H2201_002776 [Coniosporium apollinis]|uniref:Uncharacterized protein n=1 Tax=Coniosporium apollinis TaxID=61459 RepID=A0ABQ9NYA8_9PEZI|nr:hypothetical protein H2201_002776 [Coniosporium apollinis]